MKTTDWFNLYREKWGADIVDGAVAHPAKYSRGLIRKIYQHMLESGWVRPGDTVIDPFGGVALGGLDAMYYGLHWVGCELEERFHVYGAGMDCPGFDQDFWRRYNGRGVKWQKLHICPECGDLLDNPPPAVKWYGVKRRPMPSRSAHRYGGNIGLWASKYALPGSARLVNGDSRRLAAVLQESGMEGAVGSPPFLAQSGGRNVTCQSGPLADAALFQRHSACNSDGYGTTAGQLEAMPRGSFDGALSSPPYAEARIGQESSQEQCGHHDAYSAATPGQLGAMKPGEYESTIFSPPYENSISSEKNGIDWTKVKPDYPGRVNHAERIELHQRHHTERRYSADADNLGNTAGNTFWSASRQIVEQVYSLLVPGAHAAFVVKAYVKNKAIVDFPGQWQRLCEAVGFEPVEYVRAWMVEDNGKRLDMEGNVHHDVTKRYSFFRRLHANKYPELEIPYEVVLFMRKP